MCDVKERKKNVHRPHRDSPSPPCKLQHVVYSSLRRNKHVVLKSAFKLAQSVFCLLSRTCTFINLICNEVVLSTYVPEVLRYGATYSPVVLREERRTPRSCYLLDFAGGCGSLPDTIVMSFSDLPIGLVSIMHIHASGLEAKCYSKLRKCFLGQASKVKMARENSPTHSHHAHCTTHT